MFNVLNVSVIMPTLNAERYLEKSLRSIVSQVGVNDIEILICDGGSKDNTLNIAKKYNCRILKNYKKTSESGKNLGIKNSKYEIIAFFDSDNVIVDNHFFYKALNAINKYEVDGVEPIGFELLDDDSQINKYCSLMGLNDPLEYYFKRFDKYNVIAEDFTYCKYIKEKETSDLIIAKFIKPSLLPTFGANGFFTKKSNISDYINDDYYFDTDITYDIYSKKKFFKIIKIKSNLIHYYCQNDKEFYKKQDRRIKDYLFFSQRVRKNNQKISKISMINVICKSLLIVPILIDSFKLSYYSKFKINFHIHLKYFYFTMVIYSLNFIKSLNKSKERKMKDRTNW